MPPSMTAQMQVHRRRTEKADIEGERRRRALDLFKNGYSVVKMATLSSISNTKASPIKKCATAGDYYRLGRLIGPSNFRRSPIPITSPPQEELVVRRVLIGSQRNFAVDNEGLQSMLAQISNVGRRNFNRGVPSPDTIRNFRACQREIA